MEGKPEMEMENKDKHKEYKLTRIRLFQWKWLNGHPLLKKTQLNPSLSINHIHTNNQGIHLCNLCAVACAQNIPL